MKKVNLDHISFSYTSDQEVLHDITMNVEPGDFVCILGQSGCGKSTLLRLLAGLDFPTAGKVTIEGEVVRGASLDRGVAFQDYGLFPWLTVGKNIMLALKQRYPGRSAKEMKPLIYDILKQVGLEGNVYTKLPRELSGGMRQRCAIARAFVINTPILLLDEPFSALDAINRALLQDTLLKLWKEDEQKKTVFFVTHDVDEAMLLANRIFVLRQAPSRVIYEYRFEENSKPGKDEFYQNEGIMQLRNTLIRHIYQDVAGRMK